MSKEIVIDRLEMIRAMKDVDSITKLSSVLGHDRSVVTRWAKLYTIPYKGRERTIFDIVTSWGKNSTVKKVITEAEIKDMATKSVSMPNLARNLKMEYQTLNKIIRSMRCSKTYQPLRDVIKETLHLNRTSNYTRKYKKGK